jgi:hypothetical protein
MNIRAPLGAPVAQLDSASVFGTEGYRFESYRAYLFCSGRLALVAAMLSWRPCSRGRRLPAPLPFRHGMGMKSPGWPVWVGDRVHKTLRWTPLHPGLSFRMRVEVFRREPAVRPVGQAASVAGAARSGQRVGLGGRGGHLGGRRSGLGCVHADQRILGQRRGFAEQVD